jgi:Asp-tRNA(Asn)/Glu-tRNA(Gln) amidotransferase A subunit family amidase
VDEETTGANIADLPAAKAAAAISDGSLTVRDVVDACEARIRRFNARFLAFSHLTSTNLLPTNALQAEVSHRKIRGPLHGIPMSVKGNIPAASMPWTEGSSIFSKRVATADATIVARMKSAGAVVLGMTTLSELAMYGVRNPFEPLGLNPWNEGRTAGGSSTGAGVAACLGMAMVNVGTDSGGSIRNPACHVGAVGFMASADTLPNSGIPNHVPSFPALGLIAKRVSDVSLAYRALSVSRYVAAKPTRRLIVPRRIIEQVCDEETQALFDRALKLVEQSGVTLIDRDLATWRNGELAAGTVSLFEGSRALDRMDYKKASEGLCLRREKGLKITEEEYYSARRAVSELCRELREAITSHKADAIVSPTWPFAAPTIGADTVRIRGSTIPVDPSRNIFVRAANAASAAALTLPMGIYPSAQVPAGFHLMAPGGSDHRLLAIALQAEQALPSLPLPPPLRSDWHPRDADVDAQ